MTQTIVQSWGRYPKKPQVSHSAQWRNELPALFEKLAAQHKSLLPFGNGRSYGDSCLSLSDHVIQSRTLNRLISADWRTGNVIAEAGITFEEILQVAIPNGWFLPVTPGTKFLTLGGAIANDVHGKNHHVRGTFGCHVIKFGLIRSDRAAIICSATENADLFCATIGGLGLTGIIDWVEFQLMPIESSQISTLTVRFDSLDEFIQLSNEMDHLHEYSVAWVDCAAKGNALGRGVFVAGDHCKTGELNVNSSSKLNVPFAPPISAINQLTLKTFNTVYFHKHKSGKEYALSQYDPFFYPLDGISNWNRIYGPKGFQQYQCVIPEANAAAAINDLLKEISTSGNGSFLAVLKRCGNIQSPGLLSFPLPGISLALDFAQSDFINNKLFPIMDKIVNDAGGRLYPAKDAHMSAEHFQKHYPKWIKLHQLKDPLLCSHFWNRVSS